MEKTPFLWMFGKMFKYLFFLKRILEWHAAWSSLGTCAARRSSPHSPLIFGAGLGIMAFDNLTQWVPWIQALLLLPSWMTVTNEIPSAVLFPTHFECIVYFSLHNHLTRNVGYTVPLLPLRKSLAMVRWNHFLKCPGIKGQKCVMWTHHSQSLKPVVLATTCPSVRLKRHFYTWYRSQSSGMNA